MARAVPYFVAFWIYALLTGWASAAGVQTLNAVDDTETTEVNATGSISVLDNDQIDAALRPNVLISFIQPSNGRLTERGGGVFDYTPNQGFVGADQFTYTLSVANNTSIPSSTATVSIQVNAARVPNVVNQPQAAAEQAIIEAGFTVGQVGQENSDTVAEGLVIRQNPAAGSQLSPGAARYQTVALWSLRLRWWISRRTFFSSA